MTSRIIRRLFWVTFITSASLSAQPVKPVVQTKSEAVSEQPAAKNATEGAIMTRKDARTITLKIPAPRGQIVDRNGEPFAQNRVAYQVALQFKQFENADRAFIVNWARARLLTLPNLVKSLIPKTDDEIYDHYRNRRWLPLLVSGQINQEQANEIGPKLASGLILQALYRRTYPQDTLASHIIGYAGSVGKLPTGPINFNDPLWEESEGRSGLEKIFNSQLSGDPGMKRLLFDENGNKLLEEQVKRPRPGGTVVTTLDLRWQALAEKTLRGGCRRGAFVVIDVITGEVLVMASRPSFDLNQFIPGISETDFKLLENDPSEPLFGRAFQSAYPPASAFKPVVALAALNNGTVSEDSTIYCPASLTIGRTVFKNWSKVPEGSIDVKRALARSCNTWFYQVGIDVGPSTFLNLSRRLGFGERTGLPLIGESAGVVPNDEWMLKHEKRRILDGDTANLSIGQGSLLASPLQVAQAMAGIANGGALPKLQLIRQLQDTRGRVVQAAIPERKTWLGLDGAAVNIVHKGMSDVVNSGGGTGHNASLSFTTLCGKTGTAQWGPKAKDQRLAWFAGFLPEKNPRYAFAVLYEGSPGETVSGGRMAAPMVRRFFEGIKDDIKETIAPPKKAHVVVLDEDADPAEEEEAPKAIPQVPTTDDETTEDVTGNEDSTDEPPVSPEPSSGVGMLRALPVTPFDAASEIEKDQRQRALENLSTQPPASENPPPQPQPPQKPAAIRAIPVGDDEVIQGATEEP